jgi:hypothetical protein
MQCWLRLIGNLLEGRGGGAGVPAGDLPKLVQYG